MSEIAEFLTLELPEPFASLIHRCEAHCVAGCCGTDAFDVSAALMVPWMRERGRDAAREALAQLDFLITIATNSLQDVFSDQNGFATGWRPRDCVQYLGTWRAEIVASLALAFPLRE